jgi:uncharacterized repeat protein (TIGR01451 family)/fimbrial isopeptide formation D2 family protein
MPTNIRRRAILRLLAFVLLLAGALPAQAGTDFCSSYPLVGGFHVIDGNDPSLNVLTLPSSIGIDANCYFVNFPVSAKWPSGLTSTLNFKSDGFLAIFENVYYSGNMACATTTTKIWFVNNATYDPNNSCQSLFIPVETVGKQAPGPTASIGVPFTYTLTMPVMYDPATNTYYFQPSVNTLSKATIYDDLSATGASLTYVSNTAFLVNGATRTPLGPLNLGVTATTQNALPPPGSLPLSDTTKHIVFSSDFNPDLTNITAGTQIEIQMTVVLDNVPANTAGTQFTNTAKWWFGRVIDGVAYDPLPGQAGISAPMTIVEPSLTMTKTSTLTNLNVGTAAPFRLNVQNTGGGDAWDATITDILPTGMCNYDPSSTITVQLFASDGVTPVSGVLTAGTDYTVTYSGCTLTVILTDTTKIGPTQRLIINYQSRLDAGTGPGLTFTNVAGATLWYSGASSNTGRRQYNRTLTNGTPGTLDFQDAYTVTSTTQGYFFLKSVSNLTTGVAVATTAYPGDRLRYTLQIQNFTYPALNNITITDDFDALNATAAFVPGTLALASSNLPVSATLTVNPTGGSKGTGSITISGLNLLQDEQYQVQFDITLASGLTNGVTVSNQGSLTGTDPFSVVWSGTSDNPYVNGPSLLSQNNIPPGDITSVQIYAPGALSKANTQTTAAIGQPFTYRITVPATPVNIPLYDVQILDNLGASAANLSFVSATVVSGGAWSLSNTGTATNLAIQDTSAGIDIPAGSQAVIDITVVLQNTATNVNGLTFTNTASYTYNKINGDNATQGIGGGGTTANMTIVEPHLTIAKAVSYVSPAGKPATDPAAVGDVLQYTVTVVNNGTSTAYDTDVLDAMPANLSFVTGSATATINSVAVSGFVMEPTVLPGGMLVWGAQNGDGNLDIPVGGTLVLSYRATVLSVNGTSITNSVYTDWASLNGGVVGERNGAGCPSWTAPDNYCSGPAISTVTALDPTALAKAVASDSWTTAPSTANDATLRPGDTVVYTLTATLREGTTQNVVIADTLPVGMAFDSVVSINGDTTAPYSSAAPFTYSDFSGPVISGNTVTWNFGNVTNAVDNLAANNGLVIQYRARVLNAIPATPTSQMLTNSATLNYAIGGVAGTQKTASVPINVWQPLLDISKSAAPAGGDTVLVAGESVVYTVNIQNTGIAPAYNTVLRDILPTGMCNTSPAATVVAQVFASDGVTPVSGVLAAGSDYTVTYSGCTLTVTMLSAATAIAPTQRLIVKYTAQADATVGAGVILANQAQVTHYYSLDSADANAAYRKDYGATGTATVQLTTASATALSKQTLVSTAAIGQPFTYRITIPSASSPTALYDVKVLDDISLATTGVSLTYLSSSARLASNTRTWTSLTNTGTATNLVLQDTATGGLDIPANDQLIVDVVLVLNNDTTNNTAGKSFTNTANYQYNSLNNDNTTQGNGAPGASGAITIVAPSLVMTKSGPATMQNGLPGTFTLNVQNTGAATAWNVVISDILPNVTTPPTGGMCGAAPNILTANVYQSDGTTLVSALTLNTDYTVSFAPAPACTLTINLLTSAAAIAPTNRLIVTYSASLDAGTSTGISLTNVAGATQWLSADPSVPGTSGYIHAFANTLTNGTPGVPDFQDALTLTTAAPVLTFTKTAFNETTGQSGATARPGDTLLYTLTIQNTSPVPASGFALTDDLDVLNATAMFVPGSLQLVTVPAGANTTLTSATGGSKGSGLVSISGLNIDAQGGANATVTVQFRVRLVPVIANSTVVLNQAQIGGSQISTQLSDDPSINVVAADPTRTVIASAPAFRVQKTVQDITSGTAVVMAGDVLRYTITVKNIGTENANGVTLADAIPAFTTYVAGSTRLNGNLAADPFAGVSALQGGMLINAPQNTTPGVMLADATATPGNVATITFDVRIDTNVVNGAIVSNQGFVNGSGTASGVFSTAPSDDPNTAAVNDPTRVIVGNLPLLNATKTVVLQVDNNGNGTIDAGDTVRYTITVNNYSATPATGVTLTDAVPANTSYVANTVFLNGAGVGQPDGGVSPLIAGIGINSPGAAAGTIAAGGQAVVTFDVQVSGTVIGGTTISNQGSVTSSQLPALPTDADGNASNGYQPTTFVVGSAQQLAIAKSVAVVGGGAALPGSTLQYTVTVTNTGTVAATGVVMTDNLSSLSGLASYVAGSATLNSSTAGVSYAAPVITANYSATYGDLAPGATATLRFRVLIASGVTTGTTLTNTAQVAWNTPAVTASASASIDIGAIPGYATLTGTVWHDANFNNTFDSGELVLAGWTVELYRNSVLLGTTTTNAGGVYQFASVTPSTTTADQYEIRFSAPGATTTTARLGLADSIFTNGLQQISAIVAGSGSVVGNLNLPIDPDGVVYNSVTRTPVAGATLTMVDAASSTPLPSSCFDDPAQQGQVTLASGYYKFDINFSSGSCPSGGNYLIQVTVPATGYVTTESQIIPPTTNSTTAAYSVASCPNDALGTPAGYCEAQASESAPALAIPAGAGTRYYLHVTLDNGGTPPQHSQLFNNHIPIDPVLTAAVAISKTTPVINTARGQMVPYTITIQNTLSATLTQLVVIDMLPPGFKYVAGSARYDSTPAEPVRNGRELRWENIMLVPGERHTIRLLAIVGSGVSEGRYVNQAQMITALTGGFASGVATATVQVMPDPTFDCTDVIGRVYEDTNGNGYPDTGEKGLPGVRVVSARGLIATTDQYGRYHLTCAAVPNETRGSNFILKVDERSLPAGFRVTTENPLVRHATRGKMIKFNFGASLHHVVRLDMSDDVFEPNTTTMRPQWIPRLSLLLGELRKTPSILRLAYLADVDDPSLARRRLDSVKQEIAARWQQPAAPYVLRIETEIYWRRGAPPARGSIAP